MSKVTWQELFDKIRSLNEQNVKDKKNDAIEDTRFDGPVLFMTSRYEGTGKIRN